MKGSAPHCWITRFQWVGLGILMVVLLTLVLAQANPAMAQGAGEIRGSVYEDSNSNGLREDSENGIAGAIVSARDAATDGQVYLQSCTTGPDGAYVFTNLDAGEYVVEVCSPAGKIGATADILHVVVGSEVTAGNDFGVAAVGFEGIGAEPGVASNAGEGDPDLSRLARAGASVQPAAEGENAPNQASANPRFTILHHFGAQSDNGRIPYGSLVWYKGVFYGTTTYGGPPYDVPLTEPILNGGNVFRMNKDGTGFRILHEFASDTRDGRQPKNGRKPWNGLALKGAMVYGSTVHGGRNYWGGVLYQMRTDGSGFRVLRSFGDLGDGRSGATSPILIGSVLYGMTRWGGNGAGTIYSYDIASKIYRQLHRFAADGSDGSNPLGAMTSGGDGFLYGLAWLGGANNMGALFRIRPDGSAFEVLHHFSGGTEGKYPYDSLVFDGRRTLYGATLGAYGNDPSDLGVIFKYDLARRAYTVLHRFGGGAADSGKPNGSVVVSPDGLRLYGVTHGDEVWGGQEFGAIYRMNSDGTGFELLYEFTGGMAGDTPMRTPLLIDGMLYGMTAYGGAADSGVIYRYKLPQ